MRVEQSREELGGEKRRVAGEHEHLVRVADGFAGRADGVAGAERLALDGHLEAREGVRRRG